VVKKPYTPAEIEIVLPWDPRFKDLMEQVARENPEKQKTPAQGGRTATD